MSEKVEPDPLGALCPTHEARLLERALIASNAKKEVVCLVCQWLEEIHSRALADARRRIHELENDLAVARVREQALVARKVKVPTPDELWAQIWADIVPIINRTKE